MPSIKIESPKELLLKSNEIRQDCIHMLEEAKSGHSAGPLGMADIFTALYFNAMEHDPEDPTMPTRDRFVLSNGHICPLLYATLAHAGYFDKSLLMTLRKLGSPLQGHPHMGSLPGIETSSGPLGQGLSQACGMALAAKMDGKKHMVYCSMGDGEQQEGEIWEAVMFAAKYKLSNLVGIIDRNYIQIDGTTEDVMPLHPLDEKYKAFGWDVVDVDGHDMKAILKALKIAKEKAQKHPDGKPTVLVARIVPGKDVSFMEGKHTWHGKPPNKEEAKKSIDELKAKREHIIKHHKDE